MKQNLSVICLLLFVNVLLAQAPQAIPYQAIVRNTNGNVLSNQNIKLRFSIRDSIISGTILFQETHTLMTNNLGLVNVNIGLGTPITSNLTGINWGKNKKFIQTEIDISAGNTFVDLGTTQFMSVPYALYAEKAKSVENPIPGPAGPQGIPGPAGAMEFSNYDYNISLGVITTRWINTDMRLFIPLKIVFGSY